ncbi:MAG TPA: MipA/OmpV family protein [Gemmatimonadales bacterium]|nr:MipA/OmpV family protein [Gemmatimonadales bacterium]
MRISSTLLLTLAVPVRLLAQEPAGGGAPDSQVGAPDWNVSAGAMAFAYPSYPGSDEYRVVPFPLLDARFRDRMYLGPSSTGIGFALGAYPVQNPHWRLAVELGGQDSRPADRADALAGMEDRDVVATAGASLSYRSGPFEGIVAVSQGLNDDAGLIQTTRVVYSRPLGRVILVGAAGAALANGRQMRREFGITEAEAARRQALVDAGDGRLDPDDDQVYSPDGGLRHLGVGVSLIYPLAVRWSLVGLAGMEWLADEAANSPLVRRREQFAGGVGVGYRF